VGYGFLEAEKGLPQGEGLNVVQVVVVPTEFGVGDLDEFVHEVAGCALQPLITHILVFY
jgi:hypothetical protein